MQTTIRNWITDGCPPTTLYREGTFYYTSAHPKGLGGQKVVDLRFDEWGDHTPRSEEDADWIAEEIATKIQKQLVIRYTKELYDG
jgi:hypothetical protein